MTTWGTRLRVAGVTLAMVAGLGLPTGAASAVPGGTAAPGRTPAGSDARVAPRTAVTLVTGDRVEMRGDTVLSVHPAAGRERVSFHRYTDRGEVYVVPADAQPLLSSGRLDRRLFDVSLLVRSGYDDRHRADVPLIMTYDARSAASVQARLRSTGAAVGPQLRSVGGMAVRAGKATASRFWAGVRGDSPRVLSPGVSAIRLDGRVTASLDQSVGQIGAPQAWAAGQTGKGTTVAVLDTGVDATHPDLADAVTVAEDFTGSESGPRDVLGHGTHVASIITGSGAASGGQFSGVAPDTTILNGKVLDDTGVGFDSWIIAGMEWAVAHGTDVVNMSFGGFGPGDGTDVLEQAVNRLTRESGTLFVVAAGNAGEDEAVSSPASADEALAVGAVDRADQLAEFSSRGPRRADGAIKPEITAPGVDIVAARAEGSELGPLVGTDYMRLSGTSMATPHVTGAAAILAGAHPDWDAEEIRSALVGAARPTAGLTVYQQGAGRVDVARSATQTVLATPASLSMGIMRWPHDDDQPVTKTLTYRNTGDAPVTLDLALDVRGPDGAAAPAGMFTLGATRVTVAAGGTATVDVVADTAEATDGRYGGAVTASGGGTTVRTPVGVSREAESYDVTLTVRDRHGEPLPAPLVWIVGLDTSLSLFPILVTGSGVVRLPKGRYLLNALATEFVSSDPFTAIDHLFAEPTVEVDRPLSLTFDARDTNQLGLLVDQPAAVGIAAVTSLRDVGGAEVSFTLITGRLDEARAAPSRSSAPGEYTFAVAGDLARPDGTGGFVGSPYQYHVSWSEDARVPTDVLRRFSDRDLATVRTRIAAQTPGRVVVKDIVGTDQPATLIERYEPDVPFFGLLRSGELETDMWFQAASSESFPRGRVSSRQWNLGPFGPAFPGDRDFPDTFGLSMWTARLDDLMVFDVPLFSDQEANHAGFSATTSFEERLLRNGQPVQPGVDPGVFTVAPEDARYRYEVHATRTVSPFSSDVRAAWTFASSHTDENTLVALPMAAVRFAPALDQFNRAPGGRMFEIPVSVQAQQGAAVGTVRSLAVQVSYDDGRTWQGVPVHRTGTGWRVRLSHPVGPGFVSLRATATDTRGNTVEQTIIHAYQLQT